jgi:hypothetical protein
VATVGIKQVALPPLVEQALLVVLAVDLHQRGGHRRQPGGGDRLVVQARGGPTPGGDFADRDEGLRQPVEQRLHSRCLGAMTDESRVGPGTQHQAERIDQEALASPGLAGEHVQTRLQ